MAINILKLDDTTSLLGEQQYHNYRGCYKKDEWDEDEDIAILMLMDMQKNKRPKGGSDVGREVICRRRQDGHQRLMVDNFVANPVYPE